MVPKFTKARRNMYSRYNQIHSQIEYPNYYQGGNKFIVRNIILSIKSEERVRDRKNNKGQVGIKLKGHRS